jgi:hypothetical protein
MVMARTFYIATDKDGNFAGACLSVVGDWLEVTATASQQANKGDTERKQ